eukprot:COSAG02_NODE_16073_length_1115_cov_1.236220_2_plen_72_part_01
MHGTADGMARVGGVDFSLVFIIAQSVPEFLWDRLRASIQFPVMPKRAQYARFSGGYSSISRRIRKYETESNL